MKRSCFSEIGMSDNGAAVDDDQVKREEGGDDEVRAWSPRSHPPQHLVYAAMLLAEEVKGQT